MIDPQLTNRIALITGANHGIGAATARALGAQGVKVFITSYREACRYGAVELQQARSAGTGGPALYAANQQQSPELLVQEIQAQGGTAVAYECDLGDSENIPRLFDLCEKQLGPVDILINNHTHCVMETFDPTLVSEQGYGVHLTTAESIDIHFAINARAYVLLMAEYLKRHLARRANWGRIVNLSTDAAHNHPANISYAATKHAIESYSRSAACEMGPYGITVNIVAPGPIQTGYITPKFAAEIAHGTPLGRVGQPEDIADLIVFLAAKQAHWLTGQLLYVGGGWRMSQ